MRYLSLYGSEGFRTFSGILKGKLPYTPEKIPVLDPEILIERDFSLRLQALISPYTDNHPKLKTILPIIPAQIGTLHKISLGYSLWRPQPHLSLLGEYLLAGFFEAFFPEEIAEGLSFTVQQNDRGEAFQKAFSLESKNIYIPQDCPIPQQKENSSFYSITKNQKKSLEQDQKFFCDARNIVRILGHMATIIHALHLTEETRQRFYKDPVSLVLPADNMEYVLAAYYLSKSPFPIKHVYCVSSQHRMVHQFLEKGVFKITDHSAYEELEISLDRMLFEAARGSIDKTVHWRKERMQQGTCRVDSSTFSSLEKIFKPIFASKQYESVQEDFSTQSSLTSTKLSLVAYQLSQELSEHILAFDLEDPEQGSHSLSWDDIPPYK